MAIWILLIFVYSQGRFYDYIVCFFFVSKLMNVAFCPSVSELSFCFDCCVPYGGRSHLMKAIFLALEAYGFIFYSALLLS